MTLGRSPRLADLWEMDMRRLSKIIFDSFVRGRDVAAVMFGAPRHEATMEQALDFVAAWAGQSRVGFGYVDAFEEVALARYFEIRVLPTILVLYGGEELVRLEGRQSASTISRAVVIADLAEAA